MAFSKPTKDHLENEIRIALVGKMGVGKSALGNTILGHKKFKSVPSPKSVTKFCEHALQERFVRNLQVVDVPGFQDTSSSKEELHKQIMQCVALVSPGIHAILFVIRIGRYTEEDVKTVEDFIEIFGPKSKDFVIVVFTGEDDLDEEYTFQNFIEDSDVSLKKFLNEVNYRYLSVNNKAAAEEKNRFVGRLLDKIENLLKDNQRSFYSCEMLDNAEKEIQKLEEKRAKEKQDENKERDDKIIAEAIEEYEAQLAKEKVSKEEATKRIEKKKGDMNNRIETKHHQNARYELREMMSEMISQLNPIVITTYEKTNVNMIAQTEVKSNAGLFAAMGAAATAGATVGASYGAYAGPVCAAIGGLAGATYGAFVNWCSK